MVLLFSYINLETCMICPFRFQIKRGLFGYGLCHLHAYLSLIACVIILSSRGTHSLAYRDARKGQSLSYSSLQRVSLKSLDGFLKLNYYKD